MPWKYYKPIGLFPHGPVPAGGLEPLPGKIMTTPLSFILQGDLKVFVYKQHKGEEPPKKAIASQPIHQILAASDRILIWAYIFGLDSVSADTGTKYQRQQSIFQSICLTNITNNDINKYSS